LTQLQSDILRCLAKNRSATSYLAGRLMLDKNWQRCSDDIDIFRTIMSGRFDRHRDWFGHLRRRQEFDCGRFAFVCFLR
jgi:hypothetical protein